jgi:hypothetical protein
MAVLEDVMETLLYYEASHVRQPEQHDFKWSTWNGPLPPLHFILGSGISHR